MIDLHMHTTYSDGFYNVENLLKLAKENGIKYMSITDHNTIDAHIEIRKKNLQQKYNLIILTGSEIQVNAGEYIVEILAYNFDIDNFQDFMKENRKKFWELHQKAYEHLIGVATSMGLKYIEPKRPLENGYYANMRFQDAINACYEENKDIVDDKILKDHLHFYRNEMQNINSPFFVDTSKAFPNVNELIQEVHRCGGLCFLAHPDEYRAIENKIAFLDYLVNRTDIDGIECFHPSISDSHQKDYITYAKSHNLLISAGSDFHGPHLEHRQKIATSATLDDISWLKEIEIK